MMGIAQLFQFNVAGLLIAKMAGNKFVNGILFGAA